MTKRSWRGWPPYETFCVQFLAAHRCRVLAPARAATCQTRAHNLDNLKEGVLTPDIYDAARHPLYRDVLAHYGVVALPCRVAIPIANGGLKTKLSTD
jgi:hypothetical protein